MCCVQLPYMIRMFDEDRRAAAQRLCGTFDHRTGSDGGPRVALGHLSRGVVPELTLYKRDYRAYDPSTGQLRQLKVPLMGKNDNFSEEYPTLPGMSRLTGLPAETTHTNMVPFFNGAKPPGITNTGAFETKLSLHTGHRVGRDGVWMPIENNHADLCGDRVLTLGRVRNSSRAAETVVTPDQYVLPCKQMQVGVPADVPQERVLPRTMDELRTVCNPKTVHMGITKAGAFPVERAVGPKEVHAPAKRIARSRNSVPTFAAAHAQCLRERKIGVELRSGMAGTTELHSGRIVGAPSAPVTAPRVREQFFDLGSDRTVSVDVSRNGGPPGSQSSDGSLRPLLGLSRGGDCAVTLEGAAASSAPSRAPVPAPADTSAAGTARLCRDRERLSYTGIPGTVPERKPEDRSVTVGKLRVDATPESYTSGPGTVAQRQPKERLVAVAKLWVDVVAETYFRAPGAVSQRQPEERSIAVENLRNDVMPERYVRAPGVAVHASLTRDICTRVPGGVAPRKPDKRNFAVANLCDNMSVAAIAQHPRPAAATMVGTVSCDAVPVQSVDREVDARDLVGAPQATVEGQRSALGEVVKRRTTSVVDGRVANPAAPSQRQGPRYSNRKAASGTTGS
ncbi:hypothetical protein M427DRAFT_149977 [Gonapodya prolifera JEL478]|uniref:Uncharacterized protein n=1 Tax=Gonapodya prolifera (strain JEL478) TaxID=1344416 RepID=A0A138ZXS8_GONPJ|nr:hypothetical protein M427DRAFT_149977 [Gonapodya prolifera JEL478]|eukprot:KXS09269.1 hypothetical protein M427DRAFT_149977 [Gonapodya prolifera JEL478]